MYIDIIILNQIDFVIDDLILLYTLYLVLTVIAYSININE